MSTDMKTREKSKVSRPKQYVVVLVNDDFTPMDFVIQIMMQVFGKTAAEAEQVTMEIHNKGKGVAGIYTHEIAEMKALQVESAARQYEFPLKAEVSAA